jgi:hypothetical protein
VSRSAFALVLVGLFVSSLAGFGCRSSRDVRRPAPEPAPSASLRNTVIDYVDTDGFDVVFEAALINHDPVITVRTQNDKPDWTGRLNAWIAAWNMGKNTEPRLLFRGQIPVPNIDGDTLREFRLLVNSVVDRAEDASKASVQWFREERVRSRRVDLLKPYSLRFHVHTDGTIQVIFFHGDHARQYRQFLSTLTDCDDTELWARTMEVSHCKKLRHVAQLPEQP